MANFVQATTKDGNVPRFVNMDHVQMVTFIVRESFQICVWLVSDIKLEFEGDEAKKILGAMAR